MRVELDDVVVEWVPQMDISAWELATILPLFCTPWSKHMFMDAVAALPGSCHRHFTITSLAKKPKSWWNWTS